MSSTTPPGANQPLSEDWAVQLSRKHWLVIRSTLVRRSVEPPVVVPAWGRTRTRSEMRRRFLAEAGLMVVLTIGLVALIGAITFAVDPNVGVEDAMVGCLVVIAVVGCPSVLVAIRPVRRFYAAQVRGAPHPPHTVEAAIRGLTIRYGDGVTRTGSWRRWFPVDVRVVRTPHRVELLGISVAPVAGEGAVEHDRMVALTPRTTKRGKALIRACVAGLWGAGRLAEPD